jgi:hypothetical protein
MVRYFLSIDRLFTTIERLHSILLSEVHHENPRQLTDTSSRQQGPAT